MDARASRDHLRRGQCGIARRSWRYFLNVQSRLTPDVGDPVGIVGRCRKRDDIDVSVVSHHRLRLRERHIHGLPARNVGFRPNDLLHGQFRRNPRPAAAAPAGIVGHIDFKTQAVRLTADILEHIPPLRAAKIDISLRRSLVHFHNQHAADANTLHGLQIRLNPNFGDIAVKPEPVHPWPGVARRRGKVSLQGAVVCGRRGRRPLRKTMRCNREYRGKSKDIQTGQF